MDLLYGILVSLNTGLLGYSSFREIPNYATFRKNEHTLGWLDQLGGFLSLSLYNLFLVKLEEKKANFVTCILV